jgi:hypothetical protein
MRNETTRQLIQGRSLELIKQLIGYGVPVELAMIEVWRLVYDLVQQTASGENPFENLADASAILDGVAKEVGLKRETNVKANHLLKRASHTEMERGIGTTIEKILHK